MRDTSETISQRELRFYRKLRKNRVFNELMGYFAHLAQERGIRKSDIAKRLGKEPSQISRWFAEPGNLSLDTISDLLTAMNAEMDFVVADAEQPPTIVIPVDRPTVLTNVSFSVRSPATEDPISSPRTSRNSAYDLRDSLEPAAATA